MANIKFNKVNSSSDDLVTKFHQIYETWYTCAEDSQPTHFALLSDDQLALVYTVNFLGVYDNDMKIDRLILCGRLNEVDKHGADEYEVCMSNNELEQVGIRVGISFI